MYHSLKFTRSTSQCWPNAELSVINTHTHFHSKCYSLCSCSLHECTYCIWCIERDVPRHAMTIFRQEQSQTLKWRQKKLEENDIQCLDFSKKLNEIEILRLCFSHNSIQTNTDHWWPLHLSIYRFDASFPSVHSISYCRSLPIGGSKPKVKNGNCTSFLNWSASIKISKTIKLINLRYNDEQKKTN